MGLYACVRCAIAVLLSPAEHSCQNQASLRATAHESVVAHLHPSFLSPYKVRHHARPSQASTYASYASLAASNLHVADQARSMTPGYATSLPYLLQQPRFRSQNRDSVSMKRRCLLHPPHIGT